VIVVHEEDAGIAALDKLVGLLGPPVTIEVELSRLEHGTLSAVLDRDAA